MGEHPSDRGPRFRVSLPSQPRDTSAAVALSLAVGAHLVASLLLASVPPPSAIGPLFSPVSAETPLVDLNASQASGAQDEPPSPAIDAARASVALRSIELPPLVSRAPNVGRAPVPLPSPRPLASNPSALLRGVTVPAPVLRDERLSDLPVRLREEIRAAHDSATGAWTLGGDRSGFSLAPGEIRVGGVAIPLRADRGPVFTGPWNDRNAQLAIDRIVTGRMETRNELEERARAMRERSDAARDSLAATSR